MKRLCKHGNPINAKCEECKFAEQVLIFGERAAIMEFDGNMSREDAERAARLEVYGGR